MYTPTERSVSPQTVTETNKGRNTSGFGIGSIFSYFKDIIPSPASRETPKANPDQQQINLFDEANNSDLQLVENEQLLNDFSSAKKKRLSIQGHPKNGFIPRSSTLGNNKGLYKTYYDNLKTSKEEMNNDLERRISTVYGENIIRDSVHLVQPKLRTYSRDTSPLVGLQQEESPIPESLTETNSNYMDVDQFTGNAGGSLPLVIEHEFAPLYKDNEGNLVRPPFINIDPRERYHLLQMKKSIEASQALQNRIKYMVDPKETKSVPIQSNKVETSTQTHGSDYLDSKLSFGSLKRKRDPKKDLSQSKRAKTRRGFYGGDFYYEIEDEQQSLKSTNKLKGYLGTVSKPKFTKSNDSNNVVPVNEDDDKPFNKFGDKNFKSTNQRIGLDNSLLTNTKINVTLANNAKSTTEDVSDVIKLKEDNIGKAGTTQNKPVPSSGFKFNINKEDINSIIQKRNADNLAETGPVSKVTEEPSLTKTTAPSKFSFGTNAEESKPKNYLFGDGNKESKAKPNTKFSFGASSKELKPSSDVPKVDSEPKPEISKFSFGAPTSAKPLLFSDSNKAQSQTDSPKFSFGNGSISSKTSSEPVAESTLKKPLFSFGNGTSDGKMPLFESSKPEEPASKKIIDTTPSSTATIPKFSFGNGNATEKAARSSPDEENDPPRKRGRPSISEEKPSKPLFGGPSTFSFGAKDQNGSAIANSKEKPAISFGPKSTEKKVPTSAFSFGTPAAETKPATEPTLFGKSENASTPEIPKAGEVSESKSVFKFGASADTSGPNEGTTTPAKSVFNFGATAATKPGFNFGSNTKETTPTFGASNPEPQAPTATPGFAFTSNPKFKFAGGIPTIKPISGFGQTPNRPATFGQAPAQPSFGQVTSPAFGQSTSPAPAPAFGQAPAPAFGQAATPVFGQPTPAFGQAATPAFGGPPTSFGQSASPAPGGFSRESTPTFAFSNTGANPAAVFGQQQQQQQPQSSFNFGSKEPTPDPATIFGGGANISMPQPNQVFGQGMPSMPNIPVAGTPPVRRIAHPRNRRR